MATITIRGYKVSYGAYNSFTLVLLLGVYIFGGFALASAYAPNAFPIGIATWPLVPLTIFAFVVTFKAVDESLTKSLADALFFFFIASLIVIPGILGATIARMFP